jgi:hypothetical protein
MKTTTIHEQVFLHHQCKRRESYYYKISLFQRCLSLLYPQIKTPHQISCILPHPSHYQLWYLIVYQEQPCVSSRLLDQVYKTLVQQLKREPKVHLYNPHFSSQQLWTHIHLPQCHVGASPIDIWIQEFVRIFHNWLPKFLQCIHNKHCFTLFYLLHLLWLYYFGTDSYSPLPWYRMWNHLCHTLAMI